MFGLIKTKKSSPKENLSQQRAADIIVKHGLLVQHKWADFMNRKASNLSRGILKIWVIMFCILSLGTCIYSIFSAFKRPAETFKTGTIRIHNLQSKRQATQHEDLTAKHESQLALQFADYFDSLSYSAEGRKKQEEILRKRPGLVDSIQKLKEYYQNQQP